MKSFILKIFVIAAIFTLLLGNFHDSSLKVKDYFSNFWKGNKDKLLTEKSPFLASLSSGHQDNARQINTVDLYKDNLVMYKSNEGLRSDFQLKSVKASIAGTSTLQSWESEITQVIFAGALLSKNNKPEALKDVEIKIPVLGIISEEGSLLTHKTHKAFNSHQFPEITYYFNNARIKIYEKDSVFINTSGNLSIAGVTRKVALEAKGKRQKNGTFHLNIHKKLKMTDFNIKPPSLLLGTLKSGNEITLNFELELESIQN